MKLKQNKSHKKIAIVLSIIIVLAAGGSAFAYQVKQKNDKHSTKTPDMSTQKKDDKKQNTSDIKKNSKEPTAEESKSTTNTDPQAPTTTNPSNSKTVVSVVTSANVSSGIVYIRGGINNVVDANGSCYAQLKGPAGQQVRKDTTLLQNASTSDCKTIQIPTSELSPGTWTYTLNYSSNSQEGASNETTFSI